jgi:hypothetical protein
MRLPRAHNSALRNDTAFRHTHIRACSACSWMRSMRTCSPYRPGRRGSGHIRLFTPPRPSAKLCDMPAKHGGHASVRPCLRSPKHIAPAKSGLYPLPARAFPQPRSIRPRPRRRGGGHRATLPDACSHERRAGHGQERLTCVDAVQIVQRLPRCAAGSRPAKRAPGRRPLSVQGPNEQDNKIVIA